MATVTEDLPPGPPQIEPFISAFIPILSMKCMAGDASDPSPVVKRHIRRDQHGRDGAHWVGTHIRDAMGFLMAFHAYFPDVAAERRRPAGEGQARVAFYARHIENTVMPEVYIARGNSGECRDEYDDGDGHILVFRILVKLR
jgi:hypothetical protein